MKRGQKKVFRKNKRDYDRLSEHIGQFPLVMITPGDSDLIHGQSESRRRFLDGIISQYNRQYLEKLIGYTQALRQRNTLLRQFGESRTFDQESLQIWDDQLMLHGEVIIRLRQDFIKGFTPIFSRHYRAVSGSAETAGLNYESSIGDREFSTALLTALARDRSVMHSTVGPHRDDLEFNLNGHNLRRFGSQGQQKSYLLALKLAEFEYIREKKGIKPLLLLDDVYDKLDEHRFGRLLELVAGDGFGQVFITDAHEQRIRQALYEKDISCRFYTIGKPPELKETD
jgi:DNA replication and repair protein RecF